MAPQQRFLVKRGGQAIFAEPLTRRAIGQYMADGTFRHDDSVVAENGDETSVGEFLGAGSNGASGTVPFAQSSVSSTRAPALTGGNIMTRPTSPAPSGPAPIATQTQTPTPTQPTPTPTQTPQPTPTPTQTPQPTPTPTQTPQPTPTPTQTRDSNWPLAIAAILAILAFALLGWLFASHQQVQPQAAPVVNCPEGIRACSLALQATEGVSARSARIACAAAKGCHD